MLRNSRARKRYRERDTDEQGSFVFDRIGSGRRCNWYIQERVGRVERGDEDEDEDDRRSEERSSERATGGREDLWGTFVFFRRCEDLAGKLLLTKGDFGQWEFADGGA